MTNSPYTIRNYQPTDFDKYVQLRIEAEKVEPTGRLTSPQNFAEYMGRPDYSPEQNIYIAEKAGNIVGYIDLTLEMTLRVVILDCWIQPGHRQKGLATNLLGSAIRRAREMAVQLARVNIMEDNTVTRDVLSRLGFKQVRRYLLLKVDMDRINQQDIEQASLSCRHLKQGEQDKLTHIQNLAFAGQWGYNPNTVEEITYHTTQSNFTPEDVVFACDGDRVIGYCWTGVIDDNVVNAGERKGVINMIGTDPDYRGQGIGKGVLLAGLAHLKNKDVQMTELTVDSENKVAWELYRSVGFEIQRRSLWYEKVLS